MEVYIGVGVLFIAWLVVAFAEHQSKTKRLQQMSKPFPEEYKRILDKNFKTVNKFPDEMKLKLFGLINVFLAEKDFVGCNELKVTDEIRVTIAAQACLLLVNNNTQNWYKKLHTILVYPSAYVAKGHDGAESCVRLGESWGGGSIVLSWSSSRHGGVNFQDGQNVIIHEFAHQLDQVDGVADGVPTLESGCYASWATLLGKEHKSLVNKTMKNQKTVLDKYGATNTAEFFAVASECFFEKPRQFSKKHSGLYEELKDYYGCDPLDWVK
jgi:MtfA peptidase